MNINGVQIDATFAEAFPMRATRVIITAQNMKWAYHAAQAMTGFATSVIACGCEAGIERELDPSETPDGRPGISALIFAMGAKTLAKQVETRAGQCVLTSPHRHCSPASMRAKKCLWARISVFSETGSKFPSASMANGTGASRSWTASSSAKTRPTVLRP